MAPDRNYAETTDQPAMAAIFDMEMARRADSFDKCYRDIRNMLEQLRHPAST
jgi:virulence-associated protein VapD